MTVNKIESGELSPNYGDISIKSGEIVQQDKNHIHTENSLKLLQALPLDLKIMKTKNRIREWYNYYGGEVYVSFSGGKDSTVLLDIARELYPDIEAVYVDTGLEYPELREFVKSIDNVTWLKPKMNFKKVIQEYGYPIVSKEIANKVHGAKPGNTRWHQMHGTYVDPNTGKLSAHFNYKKWEFLLNADFKISDQCCSIMKKRPSLEFEKKSGKKPILGLMAAESKKRKRDYMKTGCNAFDKERPQSQPMGFWTEQDVLQYLYEKKIPYASVYGDIVLEDGKYRTTGCNRTGCVFCGFGCHLEKEPNRFQMLKKTHPKLWEYCMKPIENGGLGMREVMDFIDVPVE